MIAGHKALITWLNTQSYTAASRTDTNLQSNLPFVRVTSLGGQRELILGRQIVDVDYFAVDEDSASAGMGVLDDLIVYKLPGVISAGAVVNGVRSVSIPAYRPSLNPDVWRYGATYQLLMHDLQPAG